jgi:hypothetical protein
MANLIDQVSDYYASKNATVISGESAGTVTVSFTGMKSADAFFTLERALGRLASTAKVEVAEVKGDEVIIRAYLLGSIESFEQEVLKLGLVKQVEVLPEETVVEPAPTAVPVTLPEVDNSTVNPEVSTPAQPDTAELATVSSVDEVNVATDSSEPTASASGLIAKPQLTFEWLY